MDNANAGIRKRTTNHLGFSWNESHLISNATVAAVSLLAKVAIIDEDEYHFPRVS